MQGANQVVLVVDDEEIVLSLVEAMLERGNYSPIAASGPQDALEKARNFRGEIRLLLTDIQMPEMDGLELAKRIVAERTNIRVLLMSGFADLLPSGLPSIGKPFRMNELLEQVSKVIDAPPPEGGIFEREAIPEVGIRTALTTKAVLTAKVDEARTRFLESAKALGEVAREVPSGIPHPDGIERLAKASEARVRAFNAYQQARQHLEDPRATPHGILSQRELEVLCLVADGVSSREIALRLNVSFRTVTCHRAKILDKLGVHDIVLAVRWAIRQGIIDA
jgi:DNA-binding NarL/FixJ family response regulator